MRTQPSTELPPLIQEHFDRMARLQATATHDQAAGPLPSLRVATVSRREPAGPLVEIFEPSSASITPESHPEPLEKLRSPMQTAFTVLGLVTVPFIAYVLSSKAGFDLVTLSYPLLAVVTAVGTVAIWTNARGGERGHKFAAAVTRQQTRYWITLQIVPIIGFELWRHGGRLSGVYPLVPLFALACAFLWTAGTSPLERSPISRGSTTTPA